MSVEVAFGVLQVWFVRTLGLLHKYNLFQIFIGFACGGGGYLWNTISVGLGIPVAFSSVHSPDSIRMKNTYVSETHVLYVSCYVSLGHLQSDTDKKYRSCFG